MLRPEPLTPPVSLLLRPPNPQPDSTYPVTKPAPAKAGGNTTTHEVVAQQLHSDAAEAPPIPALPLCGHPPAITLPFGDGRRTASAEPFSSAPSYPSCRRPDLHCIRRRSDPHLSRHPLRAAELDSVSLQQNSSPCNGCVSERKGTRFAVVLATATANCRRRRCQNYPLPSATCH